MIIVKSSRLFSTFGVLKNLSKNLSTVTEAFVRDLELSCSHLTPEIKLHLLTPRHAAYHEPAEKSNLSDPWWAIYWPGGQVLARYVLDNPFIVKKKKVLDLGSGSGAVSIAALRSGASSVIANDIDPSAAVALKVNAQVNGIKTGFTSSQTNILDISSQPNILDGNLEILDNVNVLLIGDMFYDEDIGSKVVKTCQMFKEKSDKNEVYLGDPGRWFLESNPRTKQLLSCVAKYELEENCKSENSGFNHGLVWRFN